jgi:hypothetical protein
MNFLSQLLPGFRHVRGPLIAGYIWLFVAWLFLADNLPQRHESKVYLHAFELGDFVGPVGLAVAVSVAAYLIGSLFQAGVAALGEIFSTLKRNRFRRTWYAVLWDRMDISELVRAPLFAPTDVGWLDGDRRTRDSLQSLSDARLSESRDRLREAIFIARQRMYEGFRNAGRPTSFADIDINLSLSGTSADEPIVTAFRARTPVGKSTRRLPEERVRALPVFSATRDLFDERGAIMTLLMEITRQAGSEVERLYAEADLRVTVAVPLAAAAIVLWAKSGDLEWLALLVAPIGLLIHALVLNRRGGREMVEALRSRKQDELNRITPAFERYRTRAEGLAHEVEQFDWEGLAEELQPDYSSAGHEPAGLSPET